MAETIDAALDCLHYTGPDLSWVPTFAPGLMAAATYAAEGAHIMKFTDKYTEACLRAYARNPKPVYLGVVRNVAARVGARWLPGARSRGWH